MEQAFMSTLPPPPAPELTLLVMSLLLNRRILEAVMLIRPPEDCSEEVAIVPLLAVSWSV
jgi:hypothetical protein